MLTSFKNLRSRVTELGGSYSNDDQLLDFWNCVKTMQDKKFQSFVTTLKDSQVMTTTKDTVDQLIIKLCAKQTHMETDKEEWNAISTEDDMIMALLSHIESQNTSNSSSNSKKKKKKKKSKDDSETDSTKDKYKGKEDKEKKDGKYPAWKTKPPKDGESKVITKGDKKFYLCSKCRQGNGLWPRHSEEDHKSDFKPIFNNSRPSSRQSTNSSYAKAFLAAKKDFQNGGAQD